MFFVFSFYMSFLIKQASNVSLYLRRIDWFPSPSVRIEFKDFRIIYASIYCVAICCIDYSVNNSWREELLKYFEL
jgi:hypothetical protein